MFQLCDTFVPRQTGLSVELSIIELFVRGKVMETSSGRALDRQLGLFDATSLVVGTIIGAGIFLVPSIMARHLPSTSGILFAWIIGGVLSYFGALAYAELGTMFPRTGGQYVFLREGYGRMVAFLCGWSLFLVVMPGNLAFLSTGFAAYLGDLLPPRFGTNPFILRLIAVLFLGVITLINYRGVRLAAGVQNVFTALKVIGIGVLILAAFRSGQASHLQLSWSSSDFSAKHMGLGLAAALVAFEGWNNLSFVNGEIINPQRNVPIALGLGVAISAAIYVMLTAAYLRVLPLGELANSAQVGTSVATRLFLPEGSAVLAIIILISIIGSANGTAFTAARLYFAQAGDGLFFTRFATTHPRFGTPSFSVLIQGVWASMVALTGSFELVATFAIFCAWLFYVLVIVALVVLRWRMPSLPRPYQMMGYPVTPLLFAGATIWFLVTNIRGNALPSLAGLGVLCAGLPVYLVWSKRPLANSDSVLPSGIADTARSLD
jgi:APA family basic amino acid/polyamine antiporter